MSRRKVFRRDRVSALAFQVTARDIAAVEDVGLYRLVLAEQLLQLHWPKPSQRRHGESRLRGLFHQGWLDRQPYMDGPTKPRAVYTLGPLGRIHVAQKLGVPTALVGPRPAKERNHDQLFLTHHLRTVQVVINLRIAAEKSGGGVVHFRDERALKGERMKHAQPMPVIPDAFVAISVNGAAQSFCLELDRATVDRRSWRGRMASYWEWSRSKAFAEQYQNPAVLVVVDARPPIAQRRVLDLKEVAERESSEAPGRDPSLFWFTSLALATPDAILSREVWLVGGHDRLFGLAPHC